MRTIGLVFKKEKKTEPKTSDEKKGSKKTEPKTGDEDAEIQE